MFFSSLPHIANVIKQKPCFYDIILQRKFQVIKNNRFPVKDLKTTQ